MSFSFIDMFAQANKLLGENGEAISRLPAFFDEWLKFMHSIGRKLDRVDERLDGVDSKLQMLLNGPQLVTPELHAVVAEWAVDDPRNNGEQNHGRPG